MSIIWETAVHVSAEQIIELAKKEGWFQRIINTFRKKHNILVLGTTGTGKTNLIYSFTEFIPEAINFMNRTEVMQKHRIMINSHPFIFIDTPGQELHKSRRIEAIQEAMSRNISFIINVVSYGYHEYRRRTRGVFLPNGSINKRYLEMHRIQEIKGLSEWTPILGNKHITKGLITVVSKADIWWKKEQWDTILNHYKSGDYYNALGEAKILEPIVLPYCSVFHKFYGEGNLSGQFDETDRINFRVQLLKSMLALIGKEN
jgi:hypothetical protein